MLRYLLSSLVVALVLTTSPSDACAQRRGGGERERIPPTYADVQYGPHERNVIDVWLPNLPGTNNSGDRLPVCVYFHGGGFVGGDKSGFDPSPFLKSGMAAVSGNYRFVDGQDTLSPDPLLDAARAIQYLRLRAKEWSLDDSRIAVSGGSAGAVIAMWIGYHDDLANPSSDDLVARQSSRVKCIVPVNGPTNLDPTWITQHMGGPKSVHSSFPKMFGVSAADGDRPDVRARIRESSPIEHVSPDDPPSLLIYGGKLDGIPLPESASQGVLIHHAYFGQVLSERLDAAGVSCELHTGVDGPTGQKIILNWLKERL